MMKTVLNGANSYIPCSILETYDVGFVTKPKVATLKGFQTQKGPKELAGGVGSQEQSNEVQRKIVTPIVLYNVGGHMKVEYKSSPSLSCTGNTYSLPLFNGIDAREFVSWLYATECYFGDKDFSEHEKCDMVVSCLRNDALKLFHGVAYAKARNGAFKFKYWHKLKSCFKEIYLNKVVMNELENEFKNLKMDSLCVEDYATMFNELYFICGNPNDDSKKINLFYNGLNSEIRNWINIEQISSFELLCELALTSEYLIHEHEVHMESLARENGKHDVVVSPSEGLGSEVPLTYGLIASDMGLLSFCLESPNTNGNTCVNVGDHLVGINHIQMELGVNENGLWNELYDLYIANAQLDVLSSYFPWECWSIKRIKKELKD